MIAIIKIRRDTASVWETANPVLSQGEMGIVLASNPTEFRVGDGISHWNDLQVQTLLTDQVKSQIVSGLASTVAQLQEQLSNEITVRTEQIAALTSSFSELGALASKNSVNLNKGDGVVVLGKDTKLTASPSKVDFTGGTTATFVQYVSAEIGNKLVTTQIHNVASIGSAPNWDFKLGEGEESDMLIITGSNGEAPTLGEDVTVATGESAPDGNGSLIVTHVTVGDSANALTSIGEGRAAAQEITVGKNDEVTVAKYSDLSVDVE